MSGTTGGHLDFSLPPAPPQPPRRGLAVLTFLTFLAAAACLALLLTARTGADRGADRGSAPGAGPDRPAALKRLAQQLERRTLYDQAAQVWGEYAQAAALTSEERAEVTYLRAKNLKDAGRYAEAARYLTEYIEYGAAGEDQRRAMRLLLECLSGLGKEDVRERVLKSHVVAGAKEGDTVVARVSGDPITLEALRQELARGAEEMLRHQQPGLDRETVARRAAEAVGAQLANPEVLQQVLSQVVSREILYREALARGLADGPEIARDMEMIRRGYLANALIREHTEGAIGGITDIDLRNHYDARKDAFFEPASVEFSYMQFPSEEAARQTMADPDADAFRKGAGPARQGAPVPGLGPSPEAAALLMALEEGRVGDRPVRIGSAW